jgi:pimeloyl-ACP methyl ester carboxylesterase
MEVRSQVHEATVRLREVELNYAEGPAGGEPFVLLHGGSARWQYGGTLLEELADRWHVFAPDLRGHGRSGHVASGYRVRDYVDDIAEFLTSVVGEPAVLFGHSRGGQVAVMVAAEHTELVRALIVGDAPLSPDLTATERPDHRAQNELWQKLAGRPASEIEAALREMPILEAGETRPRPAREVMGDDSPWFAFQAEALHLLDPRTLTELLAGPRELLVGYDPEVLLPAIECPVLLLQADPELGAVLTDDDVELGLRLIRHASHVRLDGVDHALHGRPDQTARVLDAIEPFLHQVG